MNIRTILATAIFASMCSTAVAADNTILVTHGATRGAQLAAIDIQSSGEASAFQFGIQLPKGARNIDTSNCLSALPKTHTGTCQASEEKGRVAVVVFSVNNSTLPAGMLEIGQITFKGGSSQGLGLDHLVMAGASGQKTLGVTGRVEAVSSERASNREVSEK